MFRFQCAAEYIPLHSCSNVSWEVQAYPRGSQLQHSQLLEKHYEMLEDTIHTLH